MLVASKKTPKTPTTVTWDGTIRPTAISGLHPWTVGAPRDDSLDPNMVPARVAEDAYSALIALAERGECDREGVAETPLRAAKAWRFLTSGYTELPDLKTFASEGYDEIVVVRDLPLYSLCEHHLLPFFGKAHIAYLPGDRILGLSKFARLVNAYGRRLQVQERLTAQIADHLVDVLDPQGVAVVVEAEHLCMTMRGVERPGATTRTSVMRGVFLKQQEARAEALRLIGI